jgi:hypothetical protein
LVPPPRHHSATLCLLGDMPTESTPTVPRMSGSVFPPIYINERKCTSAQYQQWAEIQCTMGGNFLHEWAEMGFLLLPLIREPIDRTL